MYLNFIMIVSFQCLFSSFQEAAGTCMLPSVFRNSVWHDSTKGDLNFTNSTMSGWRTTAYGQNINLWECFNDSLFASKGYLIFKSLQKVTFSSVTYTGYMCMQLTNVTDYSQYYYLLYSQQRNAAEERILYAETSTPNISAICDTTAKEPLEQFHMLIKSGYEWEARQYCPTPVLGNFDYTYFGSDGKVYCQNSSDQWRVCSDRQTMTFNYTTCNKTMAYSSRGQVWCVGTVSSNYTYFMVYNNDSSVDDSTTYRFTCFSVSSDGLRASMVPKNCTENQIPTKFTKRYDGQDMGAKLEMNPYHYYTSGILVVELNDPRKRTLKHLTCPFTSAAPKAESVNVGAVVGGVLGGVVIIVAAVVLYIFYRRFTTKKFSSGQNAPGNVVAVKPDSARGPKTDNGQVKADMMLNLSPREELKPTSDSSIQAKHEPLNVRKSPVKSTGSPHVYENIDYSGQFSPRVIM